MGAVGSLLVCLPLQRQLQPLRLEPIAAMDAVASLPECMPQQLQLRPHRQRWFAGMNAVASLLECDGQEGTALEGDGQVSTALLGRLGSVGAHFAALPRTPRQRLPQQPRLVRTAATGADVSPSSSPQSSRRTTRTGRCCACQGLMASSRWSRRPARGRERGCATASPRGPSLRVASHRVQDMARRRSPGGRTARRPQSSLPECMPLQLRLPPLRLSDTARTPGVRRGTWWDDPVAGMPGAEREKASPWAGRSL